MYILVDTDGTVFKSNDKQSFLVLVQRYKSLKIDYDTCDQKVEKMRTDRNYYKMELKKADLTIEQQDDNMRFKVDAINKMKAEHSKLNAQITTMQAERKVIIERTSLAKAALAGNYSQLQNILVSFSVQILLL